MRETFLFWLARHLPRKLQYYTVINSAAEYSGNHPTSLVPEITWSDVAKGLQ